MLYRNEKGELILKSLDMDIFICDLFYDCNSKDEVEWLQNEMEQFIDISGEERITEIEEE